MSSRRSGDGDKKAAEDYSQSPADRKRPGRDGHVHEQQDPEGNRCGGGNQLVIQLQRDRWPMVIAVVEGLVARPTDERITRVDGAARRTLLRRLRREYGALRSGNDSPDNSPVT